MTEISKLHCLGCENNFYNKGISDCWSFKSAELVERKKVHVSQEPPWTQAADLYPSCYRQKQYVFVKGDRES